MRILIDYRPALRQRSGVGEYTHGLVRALAHRNASIAGPEDALDLTIFSSSWKDRLQVPAGDLPGVRQIDRRIPVQLLNLLWHRLCWPPVEALAGRPFDLVHSLHPLLLPSRRAARVVTIHDLHFLTHPERTVAEIRRDYPPLVRAHARRADGIMVNSQFTARQVEQRLGVPGERITVCYPAAPDWDPREAPPAASASYILFVGTLEPRKNVGALLEAYAALRARQPDAPRLVLAGRAASPEAAGWLRRLGEPPLAGHVEHLGYVAPESRRALYAGAALLVLPSFEEGFGLPALEAMTVGVPIVASNAGALPEVVESAGVLCDPGDVEALTAGMARMLTDAAYAAACAARGVLRARTFTWDRTAEAAVGAYRAALVARRERTA
ncbi:MAG: glycosyltransferase family 4 protein [Acidobacteriota bacterium]|nr:glycosyltransferase family 4 protein [Acidobacteriota bacterium]